MRHLITQPTLLPMHSMALSDAPSYDLYATCVAPLTLLSLKTLRRDMQFIHVSAMCHHPMLFKPRVFKSLCTGSSPLRVTHA